MKTSLLAVLILSVLCIGAKPESEQVMLRPVPHKGGDIATDSDWVIMPKTDLYEVVSSQMNGWQVRDLPASGFKELTESNAKHCTGHYYTCPSGKRPYLVRAVFGQGTFGNFRVERRGNSLAVIWETLLVTPRELQNSALVVNLDFTPDEIYNDLSQIPSKQ